MEEINNDIRAGFAREALEVYMQATGSDGGSAVRDLIGDLGHLFDRDIHDGEDITHDYAQEVAWAFGTYAEEKHEEENNLPALGANFEFELMRVS